MPMRAIAKKRCRAMFEPPEKGERATLNSNLSTRLIPLFSDQALVALFQATCVLGARRVSSSVVQRCGSLKLSTLYQHDIVGVTTRYSPNFGDDLVITNDSSRLALPPQGLQRHPIAVFLYEGIVTDRRDISDVNDIVVGLSRRRLLYEGHFANHVARLGGASQDRQKDH
jgi:hypothetical protein